MLKPVRQDGGVKPGYCSDSVGVVSLGNLAGVDGKSLGCWAYRIEGVAVHRRELNIFGDNKHFSAMASFARAPHPLNQVLR